MFYVRGKLAGHEVAFIGLNEEGLEHVKRGNVASLDGVNGQDLRLDGVRWVSIMRASSQAQLVARAREAGVTHIREEDCREPMRGRVDPLPERQQ